MSSHFAFSHKTPKEDLWVPSQKQFWAIKGHILENFISVTDFLCDNWHEAECFIFPHFKEKNIYLRKGVFWDDELTLLMAKGAY